MTHAARIEALETEVARLTAVLNTLIVWMAQSANSPISQDAARELLTKVGTA